MLCKNITKKISFVTILLLFCLCASSCKYVTSNGFETSEKKNGGLDDEFSKDYLKPKVIGRIDSKEITESSGLVASRCNKDVFWTHNDSGDDAFIFALDAKGKKLGTWKIPNAKNYDWEDIATIKNGSGECFLYLGDIGNNKLKKTEMTIYRVKEPPVSQSTDSSRENPLQTESPEAITFKYPDAPHNAEALLVHPTTGDIYIVSKEPQTPAGVYKLAANNIKDGLNIPEKIATFSVPAIPVGLLTGGEISPDGKRLALCDYFNGYEIILPDKSQSFDEIWKQTPLKIDLGEREQGEAICYSADGKSLFATSEGVKSPLIEVDRK